MANTNSRVLATGSNQITQHYGNAGHGGCDLVKKTNQLDAITAHSDGTVVWCQSGIPNDQGSSNGNLTITITKNTNSGSINAVFAMVKNKA